MILIGGEKDMSILSKIPDYGLPYYHNSFPLVLFYTHKSGCTSLGKWFFFQIGLMKQENTYEVWKNLHEYTSRTNYRKELNICITERKKTIYKLVRNPYKRAVSSFLQIVSYPYLFEKFEGDYNKGLSFKNFLYQVQKMGSDKGSIDPHIDQQYIQGEEKYIKNFIYLEDFDNQIRQIEGRYGLLHSPLIELTKSPHHFSNKMKMEGQHAETVITSNSLVHPTYKSFYDEETLELVKKLYKKDFNAYSYDPLTL